jgi:hypothetical protein
MTQTNPSTASTAPRQRVTPIGLLIVVGSLVVVGLLIAYFLVERESLYTDNLEWARVVLDHWVP